VQACRGPLRFPGRRSLRRTAAGLQRHAEHARLHPQRPAQRPQPSAPSMERRRTSAGPAAASGPDRQNAPPPARRPAKTPSTSYHVNTLAIALPRPRPAHEISTPDRIPPWLQIDFNYRSWHSPERAGSEGEAKYRVTIDGHHGSERHLAREWHETATRTAGLVNDLRPDRDSNAGPTA